MTPLEYIFDKIDKNMDFRPIGEQFPYLESFPTCSIPNSAEAGYLIHGWGDSFSTYFVPCHETMLYQNVIVFYSLTTRMSVED